MIKIYKIKKFRRINRGFTLVETLVAISIFVASVLALLSVLAGGIANLNYVKGKMVAEYLGQEGIESIRNMRDTYVLYTTATGNDWTKFKAKLAPCNSPNNECGFNNSVNVTDNNFIFKCSAHSSGCELYLNNGNYNTNLSGTDSGFSRKIWMDTAGLGPDQVKISSKVEWTQGSGAYNVTFSEYLFNWTQ